MSIKKLKDWFVSDWDPCVKGLLLADVLLAGVLAGWLTSPLKRGIRIFSNNSLNLGKQEAKDEDEDEEEIPF